MKLKKVIRSGVLETNSSSSHSICISRGQLDKVDKGVWDLDLREDGTLYIPNPIISFGRNAFKSNRCLIKLQYAYGLAFSRCPEKQCELTELIKNVTGAREIIFEWIEEFNKKVKAQGGLLNDIYVETPEIDHESVDLYDEVFETEDTLKNFIFNPDSWLYGGSDDEESPDGFKAEWYSLSDEEENAVLTIHLGGEIGDIDIDINNIISDNPHEIDNKVISDNRITGLYVKSDGCLDYTSEVSQYPIKGISSYTYPTVIDIGKSTLMLVVYPLSRDVQRKLVTISWRAQQYTRYNLEEITEISGLQANVENGFRTFPITINSKMFGKLC